MYRYLCRFYDQSEPSQISTVVDECNKLLIIARYLPIVVIIGFVVLYCLFCNKRKKHDPKVMYLETKNCRCAAKYCIYKI